MILEIVFAGGMAIAAGFDLARRRIPNRLNVSLLLAGLAVRGVTGGFPSLGIGLLGALVGLGLMLIPFQARLIGGGDVKLIIAGGAWLGPFGVTMMTLFGLVGGGVLSLAVTLLGGAELRREVAANLKGALYARQAPTVPRRQRAQLVPLAVSLGGAAVGVLCSLGGIHG